MQQCAVCCIARPPTPAPLLLLPPLYAAPHQGFKTLEVLVLIVWGLMDLIKTLDLERVLMSFVWGTSSRPSIPVYVHQRTLTLAPCAQFHSA